MKKFILIYLLPIFCISQTQIGIDIDGENAFDRSGWSVSLSDDGNRLAIGSPFNAANGAGSGHVKVFQNIDNNWTQIGNNITGEAADDRSGSSVFLSADGTVLAIGAPRNDGNGNNAGHVRVYKSILDNWTQVGNDIDGEAASNFFGDSISLSSDGNILAVGAPLNNGNGTASGHVRVFQNIDDNWIQIGNNINGEAAGDLSGNSISLSSDGNILAIGARGNDGNGSNSGHVRVFKNINNNWIQIGNDIDGEAINDFSGWSVTLSENGNFVAVGAIGNDENGEDSGHVKVYENLDETWTQIGNNINGEDAGDSSGGQVFLSGDGTILAIGAAGNDGNGQDSGHVRVFQYNFGSWNQIGNDIDGEAANDFSGESISLSKDGGKIAIGASSNTGNGSFSGHVRVFGLSNILSSDSFVQTNFNLYPNPATNFIILDLQENIRLEKINIYSTLGQLIKTETDTFISVNNLSKGTYFVEVISNRGKTTKVLLIK